MCPRMGCRKMPHKASTGSADAVSNAPEAVTSELLSPLERAWAPRCICAPNQPPIFWAAVPTCAPSFAAAGTVACEGWPLGEKRDAAPNVRQHAKPS